VLVTFDLQAATAEHRSLLLRHCYRMLGSWAEAEDLVQDALERAWRARDQYRGEASLKHWLLRIATNTCLNALSQRRARSLPQFDEPPARADFPFLDPEPERFVTPAPDARLYPDPETQTESRESVALAFVALLQRVPPRQRAALLLKDVLGWSAEEIAETLALSLPSVNSALHRAREAIARQPMNQQPPSSVVSRFVQAWETRDLDGLVGLLREDITLSMPPRPLWLDGAADVLEFFQSERFSAYWQAGVRLRPTHANGQQAFAFYHRAPDGWFRPHSLMVTRFIAHRAAELVVFLEPSHFEIFDLPAVLDRTI